MTLKELEEKYPALKEYTKQMPPDIRSRCTVRTHAAGSIIHQKDIELTCFGIIVSGETRVINEFENGNVYIANRIFETRLYNMFLLQTDEQESHMYREGARMKNQFIQNGHLNMRKVLEKFVEYCQG